MWAGFIGILSFSVWAGTHSEIAHSAATSLTRTVTVNATVSPDIEIYTSETTINLSVTNPGTAVSDSTLDIDVLTNCESGYKLYQYHNNNLKHTDAVTIINPTLPGSVDAPVPYGTYKGLGFSLCGTPAETIWATGTNFSTFAAAALTECNCYAAYSSGNTVMNVTFKLDVVTTQKSGVYTNQTYWYAITNT